MDTESQEKLDYVADRIAQRLEQKCPPTAALSAVQTDPPSCSSHAEPNGCENLLFSQITLDESNRSGRTTFKVVEGKTPVAPGQSIVLEQSPRPGWATGCYVLKYRLANNGNNHDEIKIEWFIDEHPLDVIHYGDDIYQLDNTFIGDGKLPVPLARGKHCCIGANNRLRARISHTGVSNQIESVRLYVEHAKAVKCCSGCAAGRGCQSGCQNAKDE